MRCIRLFALRYMHPCMGKIASSTVGDGEAKRDARTGVLNKTVTQRTCKVRYTMCHITLPSFGTPHSHLVLTMMLLW